MRSFNSLQDHRSFYQFERFIYNSLSRNAPVLFAFSGQLPYDMQRRNHFIAITGIRLGLNGLTEFFFHDTNGEERSVFDNRHLAALVQGQSFLIFHSNVDRDDQPPPQVNEWVPMTDDDLNDPLQISSQSRCNLLSFSNFNYDFSRMKRSSGGVTKKVSSSKQIQSFSSVDDTWAEYYKVMFPYEIEGQYYMYGQNDYSYNWFIQRIHANGTLGDETSHGEWDHFYQIQFPMKIGNRVFFFGHNEYSWFIRELTKDGKMGPLTDNDYFNEHYNVIFPFSIRSKQYIFGQSIRHGLNYFIQEITAEGKLGTETSHGLLDGNYHIQCPFSIKNRHYFYGQSLDKKHKYFIKELYSNGTMSGDILNGSWELTKNKLKLNLDYPSTSFKYSIGNKRFRFRQYKETRYIFVEEFL